MCYPFGSYNSNTINVLKKLNCSNAIFNKSKIADLNAKKIFELPRKDTNDYRIFSSLVYLDHNLP